MAVKSFRDLTVWQRGIELTEAIYRQTQGFPKYETYGLSSQLQLLLFQFHRISRRVTNAIRQKSICTIFRMRQVHLPKSKRS